MARRKWRPRYPSKIVETPLTCSTGKDRYETWDRAHATSVRLAISTRGNCGQADLSPCELCKGYHLT